jgi:hypothetical protein
MNPPCYIAIVQALMIPDGSHGMGREGPVRITCRFPVVLNQIAKGDAVAESVPHHTQDPGHVCNS